MPFNPDDIRQKLAPTIPGVTTSYRAPTASPEVVLGRVTDRLGASYNAVEAIIRQGVWEHPGVGDACAYLGIRYYDHACTAPNIFRYIWQPELYRLAQIKLADALTLSTADIPRDLRLRWCVDVLRWVEIALATTGVGVGFMFGGEDYTRRGRVLKNVVGPPAARSILGGLWQAAQDNGAELLWPIGMGSMFRLSTASGEAGPGVAYRNAGSGGSLGARHDHPEWSQIGPGSGETPPLLLMRALQVDGNALFPAPDNVVDLLDLRVPEAKRARARGRLMPSAGPVMAYVRKWAEYIARTSHLEFTTEIAWERYIRYLFTFPPEHLGMTRAELEELNRAVARARSEAAIEVGRESGAGYAARAGKVGGLIVTTAYAIMGVIAAAIGEARGCPYVPRAFLLRSFRTAECNLLASGDRTTRDAVQNLITMGSRVNYRFRNPWGDEPQPDLVIQDPVVDINTGLALKLLAAAVGGAAGLVGATWWKNR